METKRRMTEKKKPGRKKIGNRESFACPDDLHDWIDYHRKENGLDDWSEAVRHLIREHKRLKTYSGKVQ